MASAGTRRLSSCCCRTVGVGPELWGQSSRYRGRAGWCRGGSSESASNRFPHFESGRRTQSGQSELIDLLDRADHNPLACVQTCVQTHAQTCAQTNRHACVDRPITIRWPAIIPCACTRMCLVAGRAILPSWPSPQPTKIAWSSGTKSETAALQTEL